MIIVENKKKSLKNLTKKYPEAEIIDITSKANEPYVRFSPFYPHGNIPIPYSEGQFAMTVEGIWQGLKVFQNYDIDKSKFYIGDMLNIKRTERKYGRVLGHRKGLFSNELMNYRDARKYIYLRTYAWVLDNLLGEQIDKLKEIASKKDLILLDYNINLDIDNLSKPLSHAGLVKRYLEKKYPELMEAKFILPEKKKAKAIKTKKVKEENPKEPETKRKTSKKRKKKNEDINSEQMVLFNSKKQNINIEVRDFFKELIDYCKENNRICPMPDYWNELWKRLKNKKRKEPAVPLILGAWNEPALLKQLRFFEHLEWAKEQGQLEEISDYVKSLKEENWYHLGE